VQQQLRVTLSRVAEPRPAGLTITSGMEILGRAGVDAAPSRESSGEGEITWQTSTRCSGWTAPWGGWPVV